MSELIALAWPMVALAAIASCWPFILAYFSAGAIEGKVVAKIKGLVLAYEETVREDFAKADAETVTRFQGTIEAQADHLRTIQGQVDEMKRRVEKYELGKLGRIG